MGESVTDHVMHGGSVGLPEQIRACLFDLDGVLTQTATVHAAAWSDAFDAFLARWAEQTDEEFVPFDPVDDYLHYVDGRPRLDGVRTFLHARNIHLPEGDAADTPESMTNRGIANHKNEMVHDRLRRDGAVVYPDAGPYLDAVRSAGLRCAVVSASENAEEVLRSVDLHERFDTRVDGVVATRENLPGKPAPDTFAAAARRLDVPNAEAAVFEDALAGVQAGHAGAFGWVVGIDRTDDPTYGERLLDAGADVVVRELTELLAGGT